MECFLTILSGFLVPVIAGTTTYIAYQQHKVERDKFKWSLYDRRMEIFQSVMDLLEHINRKADVSNEELNKFVGVINKGYFLLDSKTNDYLSKIRDKCIFLGEYKRRLKDETGEGKSRLIKEREGIVNWLLDNTRLDESRKSFEKYLKIEK